MHCNHLCTFRFRRFPDMNYHEWRAVLDDMLAWLRGQDWKEDEDYSVVYDEHSLIATRIHVYFATDQKFVVFKIVWMDYL